MQLEETINFACPFCGEENTSNVDLTGGNKQMLTLDCSICCRPIVLHVSVDSEGFVSYSAEQESY